MEFVFVAVAVGMFLTFLAGERNVNSVPLRWIGIAAMFFSLLLLPHQRTRPATRLVAMFTLWLALLATASLWAPIGARLNTVLPDILALACLVIIASIVISRLSSAGLQAIWWSTWVTAIVYTVFAVLEGTVGAQDRLSAFGGGPNVFVRVVSLGVVAAIYLTVSKGRWWTLIPAPALVGVAFLSGSRGGVVALFAALLLATAILLRARSRRTRYWTTFLLLLAIVIFWWLIWPRISNYVAERFGQQTLEAGYTSGRDVIISDTLELWTSHPTFGGGLDSYWSTYGYAYGYQHTHNFILGSLAEAGVISGLVLVWALAIGFNRSRSRGSADLNMSMVAATFVLTAGMFSGSWYDTRFLWLYLLLGYALIQSSHKPKIAGDSRFRVEPKRAPSLRASDLSSVRQQHSQTRPIQERRASEHHSPPQGIV